jgi:hypothetical protein
MHVEKRRPFDASYESVTPRERDAVHKGQDALG